MSGVKILVAQGGGPTAVINQSLVGVALEARRFPNVSHVYGALHGVREIPGERVIQRLGHPRMTFGEFAASRNLEFGVHTMDIAHAVGRPEELRPAAASIITGILDTLLGRPVPASLRWDATTYILVGTGRRTVYRNNLDGTFTDAASGETFMG